MMDVAPGSRRLAAVWFADIVGFSQLAARDEPTALQMVEVLQTSAAAAIESHGGCVVKYLGDGVLAEFLSTDSAIRGAIQLREAFDTRSAALGQPSRLRIGVHVGNVLRTSDGDIYGAGVNIASRIMDEAEPGCIVVSEEVWRQTRALPEFNFISRGSCQPRGSSEKIQIFEVCSLDGSPARPEARLSEQLRSWPRHVAIWAVVLLTIAGAVALRKAIPREPRSHLSIGVVSTGRGSSAKDVQQRIIHALSVVPQIRAMDASEVLGRSTTPYSVSTPVMIARARDLDVKYLVTIDLTSQHPISLVVELYTVPSGERILRRVGGGRGETLAGAGERISLELIRAIAAREPIQSDDVYLASATNSVTALDHFQQGNARFAVDDPDGAVASYRRAIEADSAFALAYFRLSIAESWGPRWNYREALRVVDAGIAQAGGSGSVWPALLVAQRYAVLHRADSATAAFSYVVSQHSELVDGYFGLGEALFHYGAAAGLDPSDAGPQFERAIENDSAFALLASHRFELALVDGNEAKARQYLAKIPVGSRYREGYSHLLDLEFGTPPQRAAAHRVLADADRWLLSTAISLLARGGRRLALADTLASYLLRSGRTPDDRLRGADYRTILLSSMGRDGEAITAWREASSDTDFDRWIVHLYLAGYPVAPEAERMLAWADTIVARGHSPRFGRLNDEAENAYRALVHRAVLTGDSADVLRLLRPIGRAPADPTDPLPTSLEAALRSRLALLRGDTLLTIELLEASASRPRPDFWYQPLMDMAPERALLVDLYERSGQARKAERWRASFRRSWSLGDVVYLPRFRHAASRSLP